MESNDHRQGRRHRDYRLRWIRRLTFRDAPQVETILAGSFDLKLFDKEKSIAGAALPGIDR
jgi:hypothetical protein